MKTKEELEYMTKGEVIEYVLRVQDNLRSCMERKEELCGKLAAIKVVLSAMPSLVGEDN